MRVLSVVQSGLKSAFCRQKEKPVREKPADDLPAETEVELIRTLLERAHGGKFKKRVKLGGFIDRPEYRLVIENFGSDHPGNGVSVYGGCCENVLDVNRCFVKKYWEDNAKMLETDPKTLDGWDRRIWEGRKAVSVAASRDEMLLVASAEGLI